MHVARHVRDFGIVFSPTAYGGGGLVEGVVVVGAKGGHCGEGRGSRLGLLVGDVGAEEGSGDG